MKPPRLYRAWVAASMVLVPFLARNEIRKLRKAGLTSLRAHETLGHATELRRGTGALIWVHAPSTDACHAALALISRMGLALPNAQFLITSSSAASAPLVAARRPPRCIHQFAPLEAPGPIQRFLKHWRPDAAIHVQGNLRPQLIRTTHASGTRMALVNAQMPDRTAERWRKRPALAAYILEAFDLILAPDDAMAQAMVDMHAPPPRVARVVDLAGMSAPLRTDTAALANVQNTFGARPVWCAHISQAGDEKTALAAHKTLLSRWPGLCLILVPDHTAHVHDLEHAIAASGLSQSKESAGAEPPAQVHVADTSDVSGHWHQLGQIIFFARPSQHSFLDAAQTGAVSVMDGRNLGSADPNAAWISAGAAHVISDSTELAEKVQA